MVRLSLIESSEQFNEEFLVLTRYFLSEESDLNVVSNFCQVYDKSLFIDEERCQHFRNSTVIMNQEGQSCLLDLIDEESNSLVGVCGFVKVNRMNKKAMFVYLHYANYTEKMFSMLRCILSFSYEPVYGGLRHLICLVPDDDANVPVIELLKELTFFEVGRQGSAIKMCYSLSSFYPFKTVSTGNKSPDLPIAATLSDSQDTTQIMYETFQKFALNPELHEKTSKPPTDQPPVLCKYFLQGACRFGKNCRFVHEYPMELNPGHPPFRSTSSSDTTEVHMNKSTHFPVNNLGETSISSFSTLEKTDEFEQIDTPDHDISQSNYYSFTEPKTTEKQENESETEESDNKEKITNNPNRESFEFQMPEGFSPIPVLPTSNQLGPSPSIPGQFGPQERLREAYWDMLDFLNTSYPQWLINLHYPTPVSPAVKNPQIAAQKQIWAVLGPEMVEKWIRLRGTFGMFESVEQALQLIGLTVEARVNFLLLNHPLTFQYRMVKAQMLQQYHAMNQFRFYTQPTDTTQHESPENPLESDLKTGKNQSDSNLNSSQHLEENKGQDVDSIDFVPMNERVLNEQKSEVLEKEKYGFSESGKKVGKSQSSKRNKTKK